MQQIDHFVMNSYDDVKPYFDELLAREVTTKEETQTRLSDSDQLSAHISEDENRRYVRNSCDTKNEEHKQSYITYITEIAPKLHEVSDLLNKKIISLPWLDEIAQENTGYAILLKSIKQAIAMYREENIPLGVELSETERLYGEITGAMMVEHDGKNLTLQQAGIHLQSTDRELRKDLYEKIWSRRAQDAVKIDELFSKQLALRNTIAKNAGYESFVEYQWDNFDRFDYTQEQVFAFHEWVKKYIVPLAQKIYEYQKQRLGVETLKPYDLSATVVWEPELKPFKTGEELLEKWILAIGQLSASFSQKIETMRTGWFFDVNSREGKQWWGYQTYLPVSKSPFIFMNAVGLQRDVETLVHEAGHAIHSFLSDHLPLSIKHPPSEVCEVASMSMELLTMDTRSLFYQDPTHLKKAKEQTLSGVIETLPWISVIDSFQYRAYKNPTHSIQQRDEKMQELLATYQPWIDFSDYGIFAKKRWQAQLHIFEVPFYYIEYGIAQLGAIGIWKNYMIEWERALEKYKEWLSLGYTKSVPAIYQAMGIQFDFTPENIKELGEFVYKEWEKVI